jgi:hypothetical protein
VTRTVACSETHDYDMKYLIYEDAVTHKFAFFPLPNGFVDGDALPVVAINRWFDSHAEAIAALPELFTRDESELEVRVDATMPGEAVVMPADPQRPH